MRHRVQLLRRVRVADELGGGAITYVDAGEVWANVEALAADESFASDANASIARLRLSINRRQDARAGWRVTWNGRVLRVVAVRDERAPRIDLICEEERT
ncbi:MAG: phage head closure protein [Hyphomonadaceae bacterium]|nr:phage head closure protein [Hyphomonadaceae bacterium]